MSAQPDFSSPCVNVCTLDSATQLCLGCFRTIDEIAGWTSFSNETRAAIRVALPARRSQFAALRQTAPKGTPERCINCGAGFVCGMADAGAPCWCASYPRVTPSGETCLCPACLAGASR
jgi:uncharacterized protein